MRIQEKKYYPNFQAGLTKQFQSEIKYCDIKKISKEFSRNGIYTNFKDNKTVAWCSLKCLEIINNINKQFNLSLALPKGIFVEDFNKLNISDSDAVGICNCAPTNLYKYSTKVIPEKTIFFNEYPSKKYYAGNLFWDNLNAFTDKSKSDGISASNFFLSPFLHEFAHVIHEEHLLENFGVMKCLETLILSKDESEKFKNKYFYLLAENCCTYASTAPTEAIACDMDKRITSSIDQNNLLPKSNFVEKSPYRDFSLKEKILSPFLDTKYDRTIRKFWNGKFK